MLLRHSFIGGLAFSIATSVYAIPTLQLDIAGGTYDNSTQTIVSSAQNFALLGYLNTTSSTAKATTYYLSVAVTPAIATPASLGYFTINGNQVDVTADMVYGVPPLEANLSHDGGDLGSHAIYPTYFYELAFNFNLANTTSAYNTEDEAGRGLVGTGSMLYKQFNIDVSNLATGTGLHFDLYSEEFRRNQDIDVDKFAPFSHDAEYIPTTAAVPEPTTLGLFGLGLAGLAFAARRRRNA